MVETIIFSVLALQATAMIYIVILRLLFFDSFKVADPIAFEFALDSFKRTKKWRVQPQLGWLQPLVEATGVEMKTQCHFVEQFRRRVERFHATMTVVGNQAMAVGFLGALCSMMSNADGKLDPGSIIGLAMKGTVCGLTIAMVGSTVHGLTNGHVMKFLDQIDSVLDVLYGRANPSRSTPKPPPATRPSSNCEPKRSRQELPECQKNRVAKQFKTSVHHEGRNNGDEKLAARVTPPPRLQENEKKDANESSPHSTEKNVSAVDRHFGDQVSNWLSDKS